jgi:hypothetical protein
VAVAVAVVAKSAMPKKPSTPNSGKKVQGGNSGGGSRKTGSSGSGKKK